MKTSPNKKLFSLRRQPLVLLIFSSVSFLLILFRLIFLQILNYESFKKMSDENRIRLIASQPIRGRIIDKNGYKLNDLIGRTGIEYVYEDFIRGEWGGEMVEVNSLGKFQRSLGIRPSVQGNDIQLLSLIHI